MFHRLEHALQGTDIRSRVRQQPADNLEVPDDDARGGARRARGARAAPRALAGRHLRALRRR